MKLKAWLLLTTALTSTMSPLAHADSSASFDTFSCSGTLALSLTDGISYSCSGDMTMSGGSIYSDTKIILESGGLLSLEDISITAPFIQLSSIGPYGSVWIAQGVIIHVPGFDVIGLPNDGTVRIPVGSLTGRDILKSGFPITTHPSVLAVPEPESYVMLLAGLGIITLRLMRKQS